MSQIPELPTLHGERVTVRPPRAGELDALAERIADDPETSRWWSTSAATVREDWFGEPDYYVLVVEQDSAALGIVSFGEVTTAEYRSAGIDIALFSAGVGKGAGTETMRLLAGWLLTDRGHHRLTIDPALANERAIHVYEKVGFKPIGVARQYERASDGTWHDNLLMDMLEADFVEAGGR